MTTAPEASASTIGRAHTISAIHVVSFKASSWTPDGNQLKKRRVQLVLTTGPVLKGPAQPAPRVNFTIEQWKDAGPRFTAPRGPWSRIEIETTPDLVIFSNAASNRWNDEVLPQVTSVCPASQCLEQVRAALTLDWNGLQQQPPNSPAWGTLLAEFLAEKTLALSREPAQWSGALTVFEREGLPVEFRAKAASELFAGLSLIAPLSLPIAQRTMLFGVRLLSIPDENRGLHRNLLSVYLPNLLQSVAGQKADAAAMLPHEADRRNAVQRVSEMPAGPERDRFLDWLKK